MERVIEISAWDEGRRYALRFVDPGPTAMRVDLTLSELDRQSGQPMRRHDVEVPRDAIIRKLDSGFDPIIDAIIERFLHDQG